MVLTAFILLGLFSCDNGSAASSIQHGNIGVVMNVFSTDSSGQKTLSVGGGAADLATISYYTYRAVPQWVPVDWLSVQGAANWARFNAGDTFFFAQGYWEIDVRAYGVTGDVLCEGSLSLYINADTTALNIPIRRVAGTGTVDIEINVPEITSGNGYLTLDYGKFGEAMNTFSSFTSTRNGGVITYTAQLELEAGSYVMSFMFGDAIADFEYGETYVVEVFANMTSPVTGDLAIGNLLRPGNSTTIYGKQNTAITFVCVASADTYAWYVDGVLQQNTAQKFFTYTPTQEYGSNTIQCRLNNSSSSDDIATCTLTVQTPITIRLHFQVDADNETVLTLNTFAGAKKASDFSSYLTSKYVSSWYNAKENGTGGGGSTVGNNTVFNSNTDLYAHRNYYTITFNRNKPSGTNAITVKLNNNNSNTVQVKGYHGDTVDFPTVSISFTGTTTLDLIGWFTAASDGDQIDESTIISGNVTYYAHWNQLQGVSNNSNKFTVIFATFNPPNENFSYNQNNNKTVNKNSTVSEPTSGNYTTISGYSGVHGWYKDRRYVTENNKDVALLYNPWNFSTDKVTSNMILFAYPVNNSDKVTISFNTHGGSSVANITGYKHCAISAPDEPTKTNAKFSGWFEDENYTKPWHFNVEPVMEDMTLHALWLSPNARDYLMNDLEEGGAYIDTGIVPTNNTRVVVDFMYNGDRDTMIAGSNSPEFGIKAQHVKKTFKGVYNGQEVSAFGFDYTSRTRCLLDFSVGHGFIIDGSSYGNVVSGSLSGSDSLCLFKASGDTYSTKGKLYSAQIYEGNSLIRNLVPYIRTDDGVAGLYDTINGGFYTSQSSVQFTAGDD